MATTILDNGKEILIDRTVPVAEQEWRKRLVLVASPPSRFLAYLPTGEDASSEAGLYLKNALVYFCNIAVQMQDQTRISLSAMPQAVIGYDLMTHLNSVHILDATHIIWIDEQPEAMKEWFCDRYLDVFDPPMVQPSSKIVR